MWERARKFGMSLSWWSIVWFFRGFPSQICSGCVHFHTKSQSHKSSAFGLGAFLRQEGKDDAISLEDLAEAEVPVETRNRACFSLSLHANQKRAAIGFEMPTLVFALRLDISFNGEFFNVWRDCCIRYRRPTASYPCKVQTAFEELTFQICASQGRQSGGRRMPRSQTVVFLSVGNISILVAVCRQFVD